MCRMCSLVIGRLLHKGLVSEGNVVMCYEEIHNELTIAAIQLTEEEMEQLGDHLFIGKEKMN